MPQPQSLTSLLALIILGCIAWPGQAQTIPNASFEVDTDSENPGFRSSITGWTISGQNQAGTTKALWDFTDNGAFYSGSYAAFIQGGTTLSTTITGLQAGETYRLYFQANARSAGPPPIGTCAINLQAGVPFTSTPPVGGTNSYYQNSQIFTATADTAALSITNEGPPDSTLLLDAFSVSRIAPEISIEQADGKPLGSVVVWGNPYSESLNLARKEQTGIISIAVGTMGVVGLRTDGRVVNWQPTFGYNAFARLALDSGVTAIAAGYSSSPYLALKTDGAVIVGDGGSSTSYVPGLSGIVAIAAGEYLSMALQSDGKAVVFRGASRGQCSVPIPAQSGVTAISIGGGNAMALKTNGSVVSWDPYVTSSAAQIYEQQDVTAIAAGSNHSVVLTRDGRVLAWGSDQFGQSTVPYEAQTGVIAIAAGRWHTLALKRTGKVIAWGKNSLGQPSVPIAALSGVTAIAAGNDSSAVLIPVNFGSQNIATAGPSKSFTIRNTGPGTLKIAEVGMSGENATQFKVDTTGMLSAVPTGGQTEFRVNFAPTKIGLSQSILRVRNNDADESSFDVIISGLAYSGELSVELPGGPAPPEGASAMDFPGQRVDTEGIAKKVTLKNTGISSLDLTGISLVGAYAEDFHLDTTGMPATLPPAGETTCAISFHPLSAGPKQANLRVLHSGAGDGSFSLLLNGEGLTPEISPVLEDGSSLSGMMFLGLYTGVSSFNPVLEKGVTAVAAGETHTLALRSDGRVISWGGPAVPVAAQSGVTAIAAGRSFSMALKSNGSILTWGGIGVPIAAQTGITAITAGDTWAMALKKDGRAITWYYDLETAVPVEALSGVTAIAVTDSTFIALKNDGSIISWGSGRSPIPVDARSGVIAIAANGGYFLALHRSGKVIAWGTWSTLPMTVPAAAQSGVTAIAAERSRIIALKKDGSVLSWGANASYPHRVPSLLAMPAETQSGVSAIAAGGQHTVALKNALVPLEFGTPNPSVRAAKNITLKNTGTAPLLISSAALTRGEVEDFTLAAGPIPLSLPPGAQTTLTVSFTPRPETIGHRQTTLRVQSDGTDEGTLDFPMTAVREKTLPEWRQYWFSNADNSGAGADQADFDQDGVPNLVEYAFLLDPTKDSAGQLPQPVYFIGGIRYIFKRPEGITGISYGAEWSTTLAPGSWTALPDFDTSPGFSFVVGFAGKPRKFIRLRVTAP